MTSYNLQKDLNEYKALFLEEARANYNDAYIFRLKNSLSKFCHFFRNFKPGEISVYEIQNDFVSYLVEECTLNLVSVNNVLVDVKKFIKYLRGNNLTDINPEGLISRDLGKKLRKLKLENTAKSLDINKIDTIKQYWASKEPNLINCRNNLLINMILELGMKTGELANLKINDLNFEKGELFIKGVKPERDRYIRLTDNISDLVKSCLKFRKDDLPFLFVSAEKFPKNNLTVRSIQRIFNKTSDNINIRITPKNARVTYATKQLLQGARTKEVSKILGLRNYKAIKFIKAREAGQLEYLDGFISAKELVSKINCNERVLLKICSKINDKSICRKIKNKWYINKNINLKNYA